MCIYINWAAPTIDIYYLFEDYPPMNINWAAPTIDILILDYPPIINVFRQPSEPFSLDSSHALTPIILCTNHSYSIIIKFSYANQLSQINQNKSICFSNTFRTNISNLETRIGVDRTNISFSFIVQIMHTCKYLTNFHNQSVQINM